MKYKLYVSRYGIEEYHPLSPFNSLEEAAEQGVWSIQHNECRPLRIEDEEGNIVWFEENILGDIDCYHDLLRLAGVEEDE